MLPTLLEREATKYILSPARGGYSIHVNSGDRIGPYVILEPLGAGGMGEVYRARDTRLSREVALKRLVNQPLDDEVAHRRVLREARAAAALSHPGIAAVFDVLDTPDGLFIVMEYVPGDTLRTQAGERAPSVAGTLEIGAQIARALAHAHEKGVVHRDLKPANVHITPTGQAKILDFGIAKSILDAQEAPTEKDDLETAAGRLVGSPGYMAPEQILGRPTDGRTDVYALGVLLFELLSGRRPFGGSDVFTTTAAALNAPTPRLIDVAPRVPRNVSDIVERAMARAPADRFQSATDLAVALEQAGHALVNAETHLVDGADIQPRPRIRKRTIATVALLLIAVTTLVVWTRVKLDPVEGRLPVVGVTPFRNATNDAADNALAAGLTAAVMKQLGTVSSLRMLPLDEVREAIKASQGRQTVARTLGASFVVEGSLRRTGNAVDVDVSLRGEDGLGRPVGRYTGDVARPFELHKTVTDGVALALQRQGVIPTDSAPVAVPPTTNPDAFAEYSQARVFLERPNVTASLDHAIELLDRALKRDAKFALAHAALGEACWAKWRETNDVSWATRAHRANLEALALDPQQPEVRLALGLTYQAIGEPGKAAEEARKVLAAQPRNDNAHVLLAVLATDAGKWDDAVTEARIAVSLRPTYWRNHMQLGDTLRQAGRLEEAAAAFTRLVELQPDSNRGYQRLGTVLQMRGLHDEALRNYEKAAQIGATPATYSNMGTLYYWRGEYSKAVTAYERALVGAPNRGEIYGNLADALLKLGIRTRAHESYRRAIDELQKRLGVNASDAQALATLAMYHAKLGESGAATAAIERATQLSPKDNEVLYVRAVVHALGGNRKAACEEIALALENGKSAEEVRRADELKTLKGCAAYDGVTQPSK